MHTGEDMDNDNYESGVPRYLAGFTIPFIPIREEVACRHCGLIFVRHRRIGVAPTVPFCTPSHASMTRLAARAEARAAQREKERQANCPRPDKEVYASKKEAQEAIERTRASGYRGTLMHYQCKCGSIHIGNKAKTLNARIEKVKRVKPRR